jgi:hypothetical protein
MLTALKETGFAMTSELQEGACIRLVAVARREMQ